MIYILVALLLRAGAELPQALSTAMAVSALAVAPVSVSDVLATAYVETGGTFRHDLESRAGACGVMQVLPKWSALTCDEMRRPLGGVLAGVVAWRYWQQNTKRNHTTAEHYNGGNYPGTRARAYGRAWTKAKRRFQ